MAARILFLFLIGSATAHADGRELPHGRWTAKQNQVETCLKILDGNKLELAFQGPDDRNPIRIEGDYQITAMKMAEFHADVLVKRVVQKQLTRCRESWTDFDLKSTVQWGRTLRAGDRLRFTLRFSCDGDGDGGHESVQVCLHDAEVQCRTLVDKTRACKAGPPVDGSQINPPPGK